MAIIFSNGMSIDTSKSNAVTFLSNDDNEISTVGINGTSQPQLPFACVYWNGNSVGGSSTYPQNGYPGGTGGQSWFPTQVPGNEPYYWNPLYFNRRTSEFVCPVAGRYRMSVNILATGSAYNRNGLHVYPIRNGAGVGVNGAHMVGSINYGTIHCILVVSCNAGDRLCWYANEGFYRSYSGTWTTFTYCLLP